MTCWLCGFETTELATDAKAPVCKNGPCQICISVTEVDEEINQAVATLRCLISKRRDLRSEHNRVPTPMYRLPFELKNHIFELLLPSWDEWGEIPLTERTVMPSFLAAISVCKEWRNIALSSPSFWSIMHITLGISDSFSRINDWILRSGTLPLTIHIQVADDHNEEHSRRVLASILDALGQCSNRLQSLSLRVPSHVLYGLPYNNIHYHRLTRLRITSFQLWGQFDQPLSFLNATVGPEKIYICGLPLQPELQQISWHRLTSAKLQSLDLGDVTQLFQYASQMTDCQILSLKHGTTNFSVPPIIHRGLKTLRLRSAEDWGTVQILIASLTLPCLQELDTDEPLILKHLPAFVHRSSCPLTRLTLFIDDDEDDILFRDMQPLSGVTDLVVDALDEGQAVVIKKLLLEGYFPNLRHLTLRLQAFLYLWEKSVIPLLLDRKRRGPEEGRLDKFLVVNEDRDSEFDHVWNSDAGEELMELNISLREDGFEFL